MVLRLGQWLAHWSETKMELVSAPSSGLKLALTLEQRLEQR